MTIMFFLSNNWNVYLIFVDLSASNTFLLRTEEVTRVRPEDVGYDQARPLSLVSFHRWDEDDGGLMFFWQ